MNTTDTTKKESITNSVKDYYGKVLKSNSDLQTTACCNISSLPDYLKPILNNIHPEILDTFYGCGSPIPLAIEGTTILDLGCGTGRDVYTLSKLVTEKGKVIGVDMTPEQLKTAKKYLSYHQEKYGFSKSNVEFFQANIENLSDIPSSSVDIVVSNCVINLAVNKEQVLSEVFRILKEGGELYFSDVFTDRRISEHLKEDPVLYGECLSGAFYIEDFRRIIRGLGCLDYRILEKSRVQPNNKDIELKTGNINFYSITIRAFKLKSLEDLCEDYGQVATYKTPILHAPHYYMLDDHHIFYLNKPMLVCGNTASMLKETRLSPYFEVQGSKREHFGLFNCAPTVALPETHKDNNTYEASCC